jgi:COP9 signalosome complex subunit 5
MAAGKTGQAVPPVLLPGSQAGTLMSPAAGSTTSISSSGSSGTAVSPKGDQTPGGGSGASSGGSGAGPSVDDNKLYAIDDAQLDQVRTQRAWMKDPKYFKRVTISPSAAIKMMVHGQSGVEKGIKRSGNPLEVMGLLVGRPDIDDPHRIIISDAQALPVEGFETRVIADDESAMNFMIELGETNDLTRKDRFCGWYHTHPFEEDTISNCYLSNTDVSTQLQWQRSEDPHGNLWLAIVIDPLRSFSKSKPELKAFRVYPPEYTAPLNECPDGVIEPVERLRVEKWGNCWSRYYELEVSYYMSTLAQSTLGILKNNFLWQNGITSTPYQEAGADVFALFGMGDGNY